MLSQSCKSHTAESINSLRKPMAAFNLNDNAAMKKNTEDFLLYKVFSVANPYLLTLPPSTAFRIC